MDTNHCDRSRLHTVSIKPGGNVEVGASPQQCEFSLQKFQTYYQVLYHLLMLKFTKFIIENLVTRIVHKSRVFALRELCFGGPMATTTNHKEVSSNPPGQSHQREILVRPVEIRLLMENHKTVLPTICWSSGSVEFRPVVIIYHHFVVGHMESVPV